MGSGLARLLLLLLLRVRLLVRAQLLLEELHVAQEEQELGRVARGGCSVHSGAQLRPRLQVCRLTRCRQGLPAPEGAVQMPQLQRGCRARGRYCRLCIALAVPVLIPAHARPHPSQSQPKGQSPAPGNFAAHAPHEAQAARAASGHRQQPSHCLWPAGGRSPGMWGSAA